LTEKDVEFIFKVIDAIRAILVEFVNWKLDKNAPTREVEVNELEVVGRASEDGSDK